MTMGERIKRRRKELGMSVDLLAEMIGRNRATVYRYENDDIDTPPDDVVESLALALDLTPKQLRYGTEREVEGNWMPVKMSNHEERTFQKYRALPADQKERIDEMVDFLYSKYVEGKC